MSFYTLWGSLEIGLVFSLVALGVFITFRVLNFPDLTVDGSFPLGAATAAILISTGHNPFLATGAGMLAGAAAGLVTGWLNVRLRIMDLLAGILVMIALYSINLRVMGGPNVPLISEPTVFSFLPGWLPDYVERPLAMLLLVAVLKLLLDRFFASQLGLALRATGANGRMARAQGVNTGNAVLLGMAISNALVGLAGALFAQSQGGADISMGIGTIVIGLAAVIVGEGILPARRIVWTTLAVVLGAVLYRLVIAIALNSDFIGLEAQDLNLITAILVGAALVLPPAASRAVARPRQADIIMLDAQDLHVTFNPGTPIENPVLRGMTLSIPEGEFVSVIGSNGAGKSTFLNAIAGDLRVDSGTIRINHEDVTRLPTWDRSERVARVFQDPMAGTCEALTIEENMALALARGKSRRLRRAIDRQTRELFRERLSVLRLGLENRLGDRIGLLSGGQRQAVSLLMASLRPSSILLLDEHTAALDPKTAAFVLELTDRVVQEGRLTTLMVTHSMRQALDYGTRTVMLHQGQVVLDVSGEERARLEVADLLAMFERTRGEELSDDSLLLG